MRLYTDLAVLLSNYSDRIINRQLFEYAINANIEKPLAEKLYILQTYWGFAFADWVKTRMDILRPEEINERFIRFLRNPDENEAEEAPESLLSPMKDITGFVDKFLFIVGYIFPSVEFMKYRYGTETKAGAMLFYPVRWGKLLELIMKGKL